MNRFVTEAIVLKNFNYGDAHKFYSLMTKDRGKISALAMGVRKISSRRAGNLDSLNYVRVSISESSKGFKTIDEVNTLDSFKQSKSSLDGITYGLKFAESLEHSIESDHSSPEIFYLLLNALKLLDSSGLNPMIINLWFLVNLEDHMGFKLDADRCANCGDLLETETIGVSYSYEAGGFLCTKCGGFLLKTNTKVIDLIKLLRQNSLGHLDTLDLHDSLYHETANILNMHAQNIYNSRNVGEKTSLLMP